MQPRKKKTQVFPELIPRHDAPEGTWTVRDLFTAQEPDVRTRDFAAPHGYYSCPCGHDHAEAMRNHQYAHLAFTPSDTAQQKARYERDNLTDDKQLNPRFLQVAEDVRVAGRSTQAYLPTGEIRCPSLIANQLSYFLASGQMEELVSLFVASVGSKAGQTEAKKWLRGVKKPKALRAHLDNLFASAESVYTDGYSSFHDALDLAHYMGVTERNANEAIRLASSEEPGEGKPGGDDGERDHLFPDDPFPQGDKNLKYSLRETGWGDLIVQRVPLTIPARSGPQRKWTARDEGVVPHGIHRWSVDGRIFKQRVHKQRGFVVIVDASGSMSWSARDLLALIHDVPASMIGIYSGHGDSGTLRIIAENGKRADDVHISAPAGGDNTVDGPAVEWMARYRPNKQKQILWVSDGGVTGYRTGSGSRDIHQDMIRIGEKYKVMRVEGTREALAVATRKSPFVPSRGNELLGGYAEDDYERD